MTLTTIRKRQLPEGFLRPRRRGIEAPREQMRRRQSGLHAIELGVKWAQPHGVREALDGGVRLAVPGPQESGEEPGRREIGIEHERPVEQGAAAGDVIGEVGERMPAAGERDRIAAAQVDGSARQRVPGDFAWAIGHPTVDLAPEIAPRRHRIGRRELRVAHERVVELGERRVDGLPGSEMEVRHAAKIVVVGIEAFGWLALRALDLGPLQLRRDRADQMRPFETEYEVAPGVSVRVTSLPPLTPSTIVPSST
jgi:hypothetical protein